MNSYLFFVKGKEHPLFKLRIALLSVLFFYLFLQSTNAQMYVLADEEYALADLNNANENSFVQSLSNKAEASFDTEDITDVFFKEKEWSLSSKASVNLVPNQITEELDLNDVISKEITVTNNSEEPVSIATSSSSNAVIIRSFTLESFTLESFTLEANESIALNVELSTVGLERGTYNESIELTFDEASESVSIPVRIVVTDGNEAPIISVSPTSFNETLEQLEVVTRDLVLQNTGDNDLVYSISINDAPENAVVNKSNAFINENGFKAATTTVARSSSLIKEAQLTTQRGTINKLATNLYATDFENYTIGDLNNQFGWQTSPANSWLVTDVNPSEGEQAVRLQADGSASRALAFTPSITPGSEPFMIASADINIEGTGVTWEFIPQSNTAELVNTRVRFTPEGIITVFDSDVGDFVDTGKTTPSGYFNIRIIVDRDDAALTIFIDDELLHAGRAATGQIEQIVLLSEMEGSTSTMDVDNIEIIDGDPDAFFVSVSPSNGSVGVGQETTLAVKFDARALAPGEYNAAINIISNDTTHSNFNIPVSLVVSAPPTIVVNPTELSTAIDIQTDNPAVKTETFTVTNSGQSGLTFTTALGSTTFTPADAETTPLDLSKYGVANTPMKELKSAVKSGVSVAKLKDQAYKNTKNFGDSIFYDTGINFPDDFVGFNDGVTALTAAVKFDVDRDFTLTAVRNAYRTETSTDPVILEIYQGGATPADGTLLTTKTITEASTDGVFAITELDEAFNFSAGDVFWVVHKYSQVITFPQGIDDNATIRPNTYFISSDGGGSYTNVDFAFLVRALSGETGSDASYITIAPSEGEVAPGETVEVTVTFNADGLSNGNYASDIIISSNDPVTPQTNVATSLDVSGQTSFIELSDEFILFNNIFIGDTLEKTFTLSNSGLAQINITSITSDNSAFVLNNVPATIGAGETVEVPVNFVPNVTGNINGIITIESDASNATTLQVIVNGIGVEPPFAVLDPAEVFESVDTGNTVDTQISLKNEGSAPLFYSFPDLAVKAALAKPDVQLNDTRILSFKASNLRKGDKDTRVGTPVIASVGTDNGFGYTWIDSDETGGPVYNFVDISETGTEITSDLGGDGTTSVSLGFPFEFYGNQYGSVFVNANGFISFTEPTGSTFVNSQIPVDNSINNVIAGLWDDLEPQNFDGAVHYQTIGDAFIVQWTKASVFLGSATETVTFQIVLNADGNIDVFYDDVETAPFLTAATVGIENEDASDGAQVVFNSTYIKDKLALRFVKPAFGLTPFISSVTPLSGIVPAGSAKNLTVTLDGNGLNDGVYYDQLEVSSNSPDTSKSSSLIELTVKGFPEIVVVKDTIAYQPIFIGLQSSNDVLIENTGTKALEINLSNQNTDFIVTSDNSQPILPGESQLVTVSFAPTSVGTIEDTLVINSNDAFGNETVNVVLTGVGVAPPVINVAPEEFNITLKRENSTTETVFIENTGGSTLNYSLVNTPYTTTDSLSVATQSYAKMVFNEPIKTKEQIDNRVGPRFINESGGPGTFGYIWTDNNSNGPAYDFIDISTSGTTANVGADGNQTVDLPFTFNFFGEDQDDIIIAANGFLTFSPITASFGGFLNQQIPSDANPDFLIAGLWDDLEPQNGGGVFYQSFEDYFIVQYENVPSFNTPEPVTFQIILFKDGSIKVQYKNVNSPISTSSTVGLEGPMGEAGLQVVFNSEFLTDNLAITFTPPIRGSVAPNTTAEVPVTFSAAGLEAGTTYNSNIIVSSNDPVNPEVTVPVTLNVTENQEIVSFTLINATTHEEIGPLNDGDIIDLNDYDGINNFSVIANKGTLEVPSVVFDFNRDAGFNIENKAPFAINGDFFGRFFKGVPFIFGTNTITATPFDKRNGEGVTGIPLTVTFEVIDSNPPTVTSFSLVDARSNKIIGDLNEGDVIDLADYRSNSFSVIANTEGSRTGSVVFDFNDQRDFNTEDSAPFTLNGDFTSFRTVYFGVPFAVGNNTIKATPYRNNDATGGNGNSLTINFEVIDSDAPVVTGLTLINADTNEPIGPLNDGDVINTADYGTNNFSVLANTEGSDTRSVVFDFNERKRFQVENFAPYSIGGDFAGNFNGIQLPARRHTITATPYTRIFGRGKAGEAVSVTFNVIDDSELAVQVSPSPVVDMATITLNDSASTSVKLESNMKLKASVHTLSGFTIMQPIPFELNFEKKGQINVGNLSQGIYILRITDLNGDVITQTKLLKK